MRQSNTILRKILISTLVLVVFSTTFSITPANAEARAYAVLGFDNPPTQTDVAGLESYGLTVIPYKRLPYAAVAGTTAQILSAQASPGVRSLHWNRAFYAFSHSVTPDPDVSSRDTNSYGTGGSSVLADKVWNRGYTGQGITVAVIDTGIDTTNPSLAFSPAGPVIQNVNVLSDELLLYPQHDVEVYRENQVTTDTFGHGTHVSGTVAGSGAASSGFYTGIAPGAHLIGLDGLQCAIIGEVLGCLVTILSSFDWILENQDKYNIRVNTNSWGSGPADHDPNDPISVAVGELVKNEITVLFAAGNAGPGANTMSPESRNPNVIAVAAGQPSGGLVEFSSRGIPGGVTPTIASPGHLTISSRPHTGIDMQLFTALGYDGILAPEHLPNHLVAQGTSMATPAAAGVVALMLSANPSLTPSQVEQILQSTATPMLGYSTFEVGSGYVNAEAAVRAALGQPTKATRVKLPAQTDVGRDAVTQDVTLTHNYRLSRLGLGAVGFLGFASSFPVYGNDSKPIRITASWEHVQDYSVFVTGYRVLIFDPQLNEVFRFDVDTTLDTSLTMTLPASLRSQRTPASGAYWYIDMVNFNPGWGVLDMFLEVHYDEDFKPPFKTTVIKPIKVTAKPDRSSTHSGGSTNVQGSVQDGNGEAADGYSVRVELVSPLGLTLWTGTTVTQNGYYTAFVPIPSGTADGVYTVRVTAGTLSTATAVTVDSAPPVITSLSITPQGARTFLVQATIADNSGVGYVAALATHPTTGAQNGLYLIQTGSGVYSGTLTFGGTVAVGDWSVTVEAVDRATNVASASTSLGLL